MVDPKYTPADMDSVSDNPEWTGHDFEKAVPFAQAFPELAATMRTRGRQKAPTKISTTVRLDPDVLARLKAGGPGWQSRLNELLRRALAL